RPAASATVRQAAPETAQPTTAAAAAAEGGRLKASPLARRLAREAGVELGEIRGSGPGGRIVKRDVEEAASAPPAPAGAGAPAVWSVDGPEFEDLKVSQMRK